MNESLKILSGSAHPTLAAAIAQNLETELCAAELTTFPDGVREITYTH
jgi:ribose-phosphate pyrophosphokinase